MSLTSNAFAGAVIAGMDEGAEGRKTWFKPLEAETEAPQRVQLSSTFAAKADSFANAAMDTPAVTQAADAPYRRSRNMLDGLVPNAAFASPYGDRKSLTSAFAANQFVPQVQIQPQDPNQQFMAYLNSLTHEQRQDFVADVRAVLENNDKAAPESLKAEAVNANVDVDKVHEKNANKFHAADAAVGALSNLKKMEVKTGESQQAAPERKPLAMSFSTSAADPNLLKSVMGQGTFSGIQSNSFESRARLPEGYSGASVTAPAAQSQAPVAAPDRTLTLSGPGLEDTGDRVQLKGGKLVIDNRTIDQSLSDAHRARNKALDYVEAGVKLGTEGAVVSRGEALEKGDQRTRLTADGNAAIVFPMRKPAGPGMGMGT